MVVKIIGIIKKIIGAIFLFSAALGLILIITTKDTNSYPAVITVGVLGFLLFFVKGKTKAQKKQIRQQKRKEKGTKIIQKGVSVYLKHIEGLNLADGASCTLECNTDGFKIFGGGATFRLPFEKVTILEILSDLEIQKRYVSSAGGAIAGAIMFGALGAIVGGRTKEKRTVTITNYLVVNYLKDDKVTSMSFEIPSSEYGKTLKIKRSFTNAVENKAEVEIQL